MNKKQTVSSNSVNEALILLDKMRKKAKNAYNSYYQVERIEQAMDYLLNNPTKQGDPKTLVRDVMGSAGAKIRNRINVVKKAGELVGVSSPMAIPQQVNDSIHYVVMETINEISNLSIKPKEKKILMELTMGNTTEDLAEKNKTTVKAMRTRISKARKVYKIAVGVAI
ncbi:hypothetical protein [Bacillus cereus]|uniref:hypothetical protein n=1 Tax=Bacillus cereus TaxID=1396 RepID=UPI000BF82103|nr:hypothetical protein [Bacillus cereus]PFH89283.1 hypothetical protein COI78_24085 [Bacillus cereus]